MYAKTEVVCYRCGKKEIVDTESLKYYGPMCSCGAQMEETGCEEYDTEWVEEQEEIKRRKEWYGSRYR